MPKDVSILSWQFVYAVFIACSLRTSVIHELKTITNCSSIFQKCISFIYFLAVVWMLELFDDYYSP